MTSMKDRQEGFERKFALDEEQRFRAVSRRNRLFGAWAAGKLGKDGADLDAYVKDVIKADFEEAGDEDVIRKVGNDFANAKVAVSEAEIRAAMEDAMATAVEQIANS